MTLDGKAAAELKISGSAPSFRSPKVVIVLEIRFSRTIAAGQSGKTLQRIPLRIC